MEDIKQLHRKSLMQQADDISVMLDYATERSQPVADLLGRWIIVFETIISLED